MQFLNLPSKKIPYNQAKAVILPVPHGGATKAGQVLVKGPEAILQASRLLSSYDVETDTDFGELGLLTLDPLACPEGAQEAVEEVFNQAQQHFKKNKFVAAIGGSHLISLGLVRAALEQHDNLSVLHLGAHPHRIIGEQLDEAGVMAKIKEQCPVSHIGIRSMTRPERRKIHLDNLVFARDIHRDGINAAVDVIEYLSPRVYLAIHLDVLDPACMPAVGRPEPGGMDWYTLNALIRTVTREKTVVGFDITGLVPQPASVGFHTHLLAAKLVGKTLLYSLHAKN